MRTVFLTGVLVGVLLLAVGVFAYARLGLGASGSSTDGLPASGQSQPEQPVVPDLTNYTPPPGCILDRIYAKDGVIFSEALGKPLRPVTITRPDGSPNVFPIASYPIALNCHDSMQALNPYIPVTPTAAPPCPADTFRSRDGWVEGDCSGKVRPDIPLIIGEGDRIFFSPPLGPRGGIISDSFAGP